MTTKATKIKASRIDLDDPSFYLNRELSELEFHRRVLHEAFDERNPLLERVKFLAIFSSNMDEFFMKRVGGLKRQLAANVVELTPDARSPGEQIREILESAHGLFDLQMRYFKTRIRPALEKEGIFIVHHKNLKSPDQRYFRSYFKKNVLPVLTPLAVGPGHPFPFISNLSLSLAVGTRRGPGSEPTFARVKIPQNRPRLVQLRDRSVFVPLEQIVEANLDLLFPGVEILQRHPFRVTRNADVKRNEEEASDLLEMIQEELRLRRFATVVRLEVDNRMPKEVREWLAGNLEIHPSEIFAIDGFINFRALLTISDLDRPDLKYRAWTPRSHPQLRTRPEDESPLDPFAEIRKKDILVHHPYHSFTDTVQKFLQAAVSDPAVLAIKLVIYRTARESEILKSLLRAVENGKQVAVIIELRARFDEELNIEWVNTLEEAGIHVSYGILGYKTHCKMALVVRDEPEGLRRYVHLATGNYHSETAKIYTDLGLLTVDPVCGQDVGDLFNVLTGHAGHNTYRKLLVAPAQMRDHFVRLVRSEIRKARKGKKARVVAKVNSLEDPEMVRELYAASMAGVKVDLIVRGLCRLRPGLKPISENIRVVSVVGRFLEHSRIFCFHNGGDPLYYIGSADWMRRNLDYRVEATVPITDSELKAELQTILDITLDDNRKAWDMQPDGSYVQRRPAAGEEERIAQEILMLRTERSLAG